MLNNVQNTNFKSRIVVSPAAYWDKPLLLLQKHGKSVEYPWTMKQAKFLQDEGFTDRIEDCTAGILKAKGGNEFCIFHFDPESKANAWRGLEKGLTDVQERLRKGNAGAVLEGFLIGAKTGYKSSVDQAWNLLNLFQETGTKVSALLFQPRSGQCNLHYSLPKDEITVCFADVATHFKSPKTPDELEYNFSNILLGDDKFELGRY